MGLRNIMYKKMLVPEYCAKMGIPFEDVNARFNRMRNNKRASKLTDEELVDYIFRTFYNKPKGNTCKYYIGDMSLPEFAKENNMLSISLRCAIRKGLKENPSASTIELAEAFKKRCESRDNRDSNIPSDVLGVFHEQYPDSDNMSEEDIKAAIKDITDILGTVKDEKKKPKALILKVGK